MAFLKKKVFPDVAGSHKERLGKKLYQKFLALVVAVSQEDYFHKVIDLVLS